MLLLWILFVISFSCLSVILYCLFLECWERGQHIHPFTYDLLALLCVMFSCVFVTFPYCVLGQVWYLIVSIPYLCLLLYFVLVREPAIPLIKWLRPKGLKVCSYVEKYTEFKNQTLKRIGWYTKVLYATEYPGGRQFLELALKWGTLYHII